MQDSDWSLPRSASKHVRTFAVTAVTVQVQNCKKRPKNSILALPEQAHTESVATPLKPHQTRENFSTVEASDTQRTHQRQQKKNGNPSTGRNDKRWSLARFSLLIRHILSLILHNVLHTYTHGTGGFHRYKKKIQHTRVKKTIESHEYSCINSYDSDSSFCLSHTNTAHRRHLRQPPTDILCWH